MIERNDRVLQKEIIIGFLLSLLILSISLKTNSNTANTLRIGNIGNYGIDVVKRLRELLGH